MKILAGIPVLYNLSQVVECHNSLVSNNIDCLFIDNNADADIKNFISDKNKIVNETNIYVNPAWNQIMNYFLNSDYDLLLIVNSDLIVCSWLREYLENDFCFKSYNLPYIVNSFDRTKTERIPVEGGVSGVCIALSREQVSLVYPIPEELKIWFGDSYIDVLLRKKYLSHVDYSFQVHHYCGGSQTLFRVSNYSNIIEHDKLIWSELLPRIV